MTQNINPIMVGRNANLQAQPQVDLMAQLAAQASMPAPTVPASVPAHVQAPAPVQQVQTQAVVQQTGGCQMYFNVRQIVKLALDMPWAWIAEKYDVAFITSIGELVVADMPPLYDNVNDVFVTRPGTESCVLGRVAQEYVEYWRNSITARPDSGKSEIAEVLPVVEEPKVEPVPQAAKLADTTDYAGMSKNQKQNLRKKLLQTMTFAELPDALKHIN